MRGSSKSASSTISRISSSLSASASFFPCQGSIFHPVWPSYALTPVSPCSENSSRTLFGRLFSWRTAASKPPPPVNFPVGGGFEAAVLQENKRPNKVREEFSLQGLTGEE